MASRINGRIVARLDGPIGGVLVIAGGHHAQPVDLDRNLRRPQNMPGGVQRDRRPGQRDAFAIGERLGGAGEILAVAKPHQVERFLGRQHSAMTGAGVIGMGVGNDRAFDRPGRVDMEAAAFAADPGRRRNENVFRSDHKS